MLLQIYGSLYGILRSQVNILLMEMEVLHQNHKFIFNFFKV